MFGLVFWYWNTTGLIRLRFNVSLTVHHELTIKNYQSDALNIIYSSNIITLLYMFRVSSTHLQEDIVVHKQHMVPSLSIRVLVSCWYAVLPIAAYQQATRNSYREWRYHMLLVYNYVLLKMSTWYSKNVEESNSILRINNIQCITLVVLYGQVMIILRLHSNISQCTLFMVNHRKHKNNRLSKLQFYTINRMCVVYIIITVFLTSTDYRDTTFWYRLFKIPT